ncbi:MAG: Fe-S cluster assembly protein IscX [Phycisphaerales bacterium]|nr:Fe-S cluster assembly protein IscX [Phycisphaerales bacterium]
MPQTFHWLDVDRIAEALADTYPDHRPTAVGFGALRDMVRRLPGFQEMPGHPVNEKILEAIQMAWLDEVEDRPGEDGD